MTSSKFDLLQWMDESVRQAFEGLTRRRRYAAGQVIYLQSEPGHEMFRLVSGTVCLSVMNRDGRKVTFLLFEPGDCFGESSLIDSGPRPQTAEALTAVEVDVLGQSNFNLLREQSRGFDEALLRLLARHMRFVSTLYVDTNLCDLRSRVAARMVAAARSFGARAEGGVRLSLRLSQAEISLMVGTSRQSVNKVLRGLQSEGLLSIEYGNILIRDLAGLERIAAGAAPGIVA